MDLSKEFYVSLDIEADGQCPGMNSMMSLGACAIGWDANVSDWVVSGTFSQNLRVLPGAKADAKTMTEFWVKNPAAWGLATKDAQPAEDVMKKFQMWLSEQLALWPGRRATAVAGPAGYDFTFIRYYMCLFLGNSEPFGHKCDDLRSRAATILKIPYYKAGKSAFPGEWFRDGYPHTHVAVEDAIEQAWIYARMVETLAFGK